MNSAATRALLLLLPASVPDAEILRELAAMQARLSQDPSAQPVYVAFDRWPRGKPRTIFAILPSGEGAGRELVAFRVSTRGALRRVAAFGDDVRTLDLRDVTADGVPEAFVSLSPGNRSAPVEILQWDARQFHKIGETNDSAVFIDLNHDSIAEIVERAAGETNSCGERR